MTSALNSCTVGIPTAAHPRYAPDGRSCLLKTIHLIQSIFNEIKYALQFLYYRFISSPPQLSSRNGEWNADSRGLMVFVHGLRNDPAAWFSQLSHMEDSTSIDIYAPVVPKRGLCSLEEAATPLLPKIQSYIEANPGKPICLLGTSNGGRIVTWLETELRQISPETPVKVSSVAGVHLGSSRMDLFDSMGLAKFFYPNDLRVELKLGSIKANQLLDRIKAPLPPNCAPRSYEFYASREDLTIPDLSSTLPELNIGEQCHIVHGVGHSSIVSAVAKRQMDSCLKWIDSF